jgi:hypothetical protein
MEVPPCLELPLVYFFVLGEKRRRCETRLAAEGNGFELVITDGPAEHVEHFDDLANVLSREHELVTAWRAQGWSDRTAQRRAEPRPARRPLIGRSRTGDE